MAAQIINLKCSEKPFLVGIFSESKILLLVKKKTHKTTNYSFESGTGEHSVQDNISGPCCGYRILPIRLSPRSL